MKRLFTLLLLSSLFAHSQTNPAITKWLQNTTTTGFYYMSGNSTPISNGILVNCQQVRYSANWAYINATGMPAYKVGPYLDNNPNQAGNQNAIFKLPLNPTQNTGTPTATTGGNIGIFINGVAMFDFRDGVAWNSTTNSPCGGPGNPPCTGGTPSWYRDAILAERPGFDCSKGHPAGTNYHHHQNPSAFDLDLNVLSTVCNLYDADGLYTINATQHSPLIGFTYDGFPVYGAYGYANADGTGGITRIKSGYQLRNITVRTHWANGTNVGDGPAVSTTYPLGYYREDYEWISHPTDASYLDEHNGRFCVTPEYPNGIYCYFASVDANHNSTYPYLVGPTYYGNKTGAKVTTVTETTTTYTAPLGISDNQLKNSEIKIFPNPASDLIAIQIDGLVENNLKIELYDVLGKYIKSTQINAGQSIAYFDVQDVYNGTYFIKVSNGKESVSKSIIIKK
jgi:YHYH protein/Secretion system C-terminal sorting domain